MRIPQLIPYPRRMPPHGPRLMEGNLHALLDWIGIGVSLLLPFMGNPYNGRK